MERCTHGNDKKDIQLDTITHHTIHFCELTKMLIEVPRATKKPVTTFFFYIIYLKQENRCCVYECTKIFKTKLYKRI